MRRRGGVDAQRTLLSLSNVGDLEPDDFEKYQQYVSSKFCQITIIVGILGGAAIVLSIITLALHLSNARLTTSPYTGVSTGNQKLQTINTFARTITERAVGANVALFSEAGDATIDFSLAMRFMVDTLTVLEWEQQLTVFFGSISSNYMSLSNCNITTSGDFGNIVYCLGFYAYSYDVTFNTTITPPTYSTGFSVEFEFVPDSSTILRRVNVVSRAAPVMTTSSTEKPSGDIRTQNVATWYLLNSQVDSLVAAGETQQAAAICNTSQYITLKSIYDPFGTDNAVACNNLTLESPQAYPLVCTGDGRVDPSCLANLTLDELTVTHLTVNNLVNMTKNETGAIYAEALVVSGEMTCDSEFRFAPGCPVVSSISGAVASQSHSIDIVADVGISITPQATSLVITNTGVLTAELAGPSELFYTNTTYNNVGQATLGFTPAAQSANTVWAGPVSGGPNVPGFRAIVVDDVPPIALNDSVTPRVTGTLGVQNGGTNNAGPLVGNSIMVSSPTGQSITESAQLTNGQILIGSTGSAPIATVPTGSGGVMVTPGVGTLNIGMTSSPVYAMLTVTGTTSLGSETVCSTALSSSCIDLSNHACPLGALAPSCIPQNGVHFHNITVDYLTIINGITQVDLSIVNGSSFAIDMLNVEDIHLSKTLTCDGANNIAPDCFDISSKTCPFGALDSSCIPSTRIATNLTVTDTLTVNNVQCDGAPIASNCVSIDNKDCASPISDSCTPPRIKTINGISPTPGTLDYNVIGGPYITVTPGPSSLTISGQAPPLSVQTINGIAPNSTTGEFILKNGSFISFSATGPNELTVSMSNPPAVICCTSSETLYTNTLVLNRTGGVKVGDNVSSKYGWRDMISEVSVRGSGANDPTWAAFRGGIYAYSFTYTSIKETQHRFHVDHDYAMGTALYPHVHFSHTSTTLSGDVRWCFEYTIAKGHNQTAFPAPVTTCLLYSIHLGSQYTHFVAEVADADAIPGTNIEPDTLILVRLYRDATNALDTFNAGVFGFMVDLHYQIYTPEGTYGKSPPFY